MRDPEPGTTGPDTDITELDHDQLPEGARAAQDAAVESGAGLGSAMTGSDDAARLGESPDANPTGAQVDSGLPD